MFKSIFRKLLVTYLAIIISVIAVLSLLISMVYNWYVFDQKQKELEKAGYYVNELLNKLENEEISQKELKTSLDSMGYISDSTIYALRIDKKALQYPKSLQMDEDLQESYLLSDLQKILDGEKVFRKKQYSEKFDMYVVFSGIPWKTNSGISGAILLFSPISQINGNLAKLNLIIWIMAFIFIIISALVIYLNSQRISKPIKQIEMAAGKLASGEPSEDLVVSTKDEIAKLAKSFNYMKHQLASTEKMRSEFIASVSHDMRTPLTSINGFVSGMLDGIVQPADYKKYLTIIKDETVRLTKLTSDILQLAKIQSGSIKLFREKHLVKDILDSVINSTRVFMNNKSIGLTLECDHAVTVYADIDKLKQILINIIDNAVKYTENGGAIWVEVTSKSTITEFRIRDTGIGISPEDLPLIFEKFYRVDKSRSSPGGTGLGLNIAKSLIELHEGKIWAVSEVGTGTEIIFELPEK
ncbi:HAMP domain-containing sensor histidine kinase [Desulfosporosinus sp. OT]|uniref:sensor histidine kinase n=1 Tax=Desulfosporosinus sp. OT TaxID=913865 RepID=UPI000223B187|nr:HAMP domain-containing sensor histidine kinase [Desulfosporosinus sp. OT]EGW41618.1 HAMP domain protein [Desulfosporosinus sp. OT]